MGKAQWNKYGSKYKLKRFTKENELCLAFIFKKYNLVVRKITSNGTLFHLIYDTGVRNYYTFSVVPSILYENS